MQDQRCAWLLGRSADGRDHRRDVALRHLPHLDLRQLFARRDVDHRHGVVVRVRDVHLFAVRREADPVGHLADFHLAEVLQVGHRVRIDGTVELAGRPQRLAVGRDQDAVRRRALDAFVVALGRRQVGQVDAPDLLALRPIDDRETMGLITRARKIFG